jgi:hypothetical protein
MYIDHGSSTDARFPLAAAAAFFSSSDDGGSRRQQQDAATRCGGSEQ